MGRELVEVHSQAGDRRLACDCVRGPSQSPISFDPQAPFIFLDESTEFGYPHPTPPDNSRESITPNPKP